MLRLDRTLVKEILTHALEDDPLECCGIIAGHDGKAMKLYRALNAEKSPFRYNVDSQDLIRIYRDIEANNWDVLAIYHSHTGTKAYPSPTDVRQSVGWPDAHYLIVSLANPARPVLRVFRIKGDQITPEKLRVITDPDFFQTSEKPQEAIEIV